MQNKEKKLKYKSLKFNNNYKFLKKKKNSGRQESIKFNNSFNNNSH